MENYLMNYDATTGEIKGFYLKSINGDNIPAPNIEITPEKHDFYMEHNGQYKLNPQTLEDELLPVPEPQPVQPDEWQQRIINLENLTLQQEGLI